MSIFRVSRFVSISFIIITLFFLNLTTHASETHVEYLTYFNTDYNDNDVILSWGLKNESIIYSIEVEGSKDLRKWNKKMYQIQNEQNKSTFIDHFPSNYYRISIFDINGTVLERKCVIISAIVPNFELKVYSDAETIVKPTILLLDEIDPAQNITMTIYNKDGTAVYNTIISVVCKDKVIKNLYLPKTLGSGSYMIELCHMDQSVKDSFVIN